MKNKEINKLTKDEMTSKINALKKDLFNYRFRKTNGQMVKLMTHPKSH